MELVRFKIVSTKLCGGLLSGVEVSFSPQSLDPKRPTCLVGPNGSGKSQFLQSLAEALQTAYVDLAPADNKEERVTANTDLEFELEYRTSNHDGQPVHVQLTNVVETSGKRKQVKTRATKLEGREQAPLEEHNAFNLLPKGVVGYTSGGNETLSTPFMVSRAAYAEAVRSAAFSDGNPPAQPRLTLVDTETHELVLLSILTAAAPEVRSAVLDGSRMADLHSFRLIIQFAHGAAKKGKPRPARELAHNGLTFQAPKRTKTQLTSELEAYVEMLKRSSTCWEYDPLTETYTLDFLCDEAVRRAASHFWKEPVELYSSLRKLAMLNDLVINKSARKRYESDLKQGKLSARVSEAQEMDKIFRATEIKLKDSKDAEVDYIGLSDGEHQNAQILGMFAMYDQPDVLFLLDEPESHFNPEWRVQFVTRVLNIPDPNEVRGKQECLLTTHSPFVPSDVDREQVLIFDRGETSIEVLRPDRQTFGASFDSIVQSCFKVYPPFGQQARDRVDKLMNSTDRKDLQQGLEEIGDSVNRAFIAARLNEITNEQ